MARLSDFLKPLDNFQYSVNLEYDINDEKKLEGFIPTGSALEIIGEVVRSTRPESTDRTRILTGSYGKGKSHLALTLLGILSGKDKRLFKRVLDKAKKVDADLYGNIVQFFDRKEKLLPVLLNTQSVDLKTTMLQGLAKALRRDGLDDVMPSTFFDAAILKIKEWKKNFPNTFAALKEKVSSIDDLISKLKHFDSAAYTYFTDIYPTLTSGSEFNPMQGAGVVDIIVSVASAIKPKGYSGLYFVYDEFSKFLDGNAETNSQQNIKLLQDIAERFNRSSSEQLHLLLIAHKNIENYVGELPKKIVDDWKGIAKRFKPLTIESSDAELFEMVAEVLVKDKEKYAQFKDENKTSFKNIRKLFDSNKSGNGAKRSSFHDVIKHIGMDFVEKCYPLHPYSLLLLPKISELVAQNERTIFTFLASAEKHTVKHFIKTAKSEFPIIEPDQIYDYFEPQFKGEPYGSEIRKAWQIAAAAIGEAQELDNSLAIKIIKAITLIYILNKFDILPPSEDILYEMFSAHSSFDVSHAIKLIDQKNLLVRLEFKPHVRIREISGNNADSLVTAEMARLEHDFNIKNELSKNLTTQFLYPSGYNDQFEMTRFFKIMFVDTATLKTIENIDDFVNDGTDRADGYILAVITKDEFGDDSDRKLALAEIKRLRGKRVVYAVPKVQIDIARTVIKHTAIKNELERDSKNKERKLTRSTIDELEFVLDDLRDKITNYTDTCFFEPEHKKTEYYYNGKLESVSRKTGLSRLLSSICEKVFEHTPKIINENINRYQLSAPMKSARRKIIEKLLEQSTAKNLGLEGSQDINVLRSVFVVPKIIQDINNPTLNLKSPREDFVYLFKKINKFVEAAFTEEKNFAELYDMLQDPQEGIALRAGVILFYVAAALSKYKKNTIIRRKKNERQLTAELLEEIGESPRDYTLRIENVDSNKVNYIARIEEAVHKYISKEEKQQSSFNYVVSALHKWFLNLTRFDRETNRFCNGSEIIELDDFTRKLKRLLVAPELNAHEFLFDRLVKIAGEKEPNNTVAQKLADAVKQSECNSKNVVAMILNITKLAFGGKSGQSLSSVFENYYESLSERTKGQVFDGQEARLIEIMRANLADEEKAIRLLIKNMLGIRLEDLSDELVVDIEPHIKAAKAAIDKFNRESKEVANGDSAGYDIKFLTTDGKEEVRHISISKLPENSRTFANELEDLFDSYGESLTVSQKAQICLEVMRKLFK